MQNQVLAPFWQNKAKASVSSQSMHECRRIKLKDSIKILYLNFKSSNPDNFPNYNRTNKNFRKTPQIVVHVHQNNIVQTSKRKGERVTNQCNQHTWPSAAEVTIFRSLVKGMILTWNMLLKWPEGYESSNVLVAQFQILTSWSSEPDTRRSPAELNWIVFTQPSWPFNLPYRSICFTRTCTQNQSNNTPKHAILSSTKM